MPGQARQLAENFELILVEPSRTVKSPEKPHHPKFRMGEGDEQKGFEGTSCYQVTVRLQQRDHFGRVGERYP